MASGYFTAQRLTYINDTVSKLEPNMTSLDPSSADSLPLNENLLNFHREVENSNRKVYFVVYTF